MEQQEDTERVLIFAPNGRDADLAAKVLAECSLEGIVCRSLDDLVAELAAGAGCVVVAEEALNPVAMAALAEPLATQPPWSDLPFIVFSAMHRHSRSPDPLLALGNVAVLDRPTKIRALVSAVRAALRARRRQYDAKRAIQQRDQFLAMLGHELRNPLGAIMLATEMLERSGSDPKCLPKQRAILERQSRHLSRLVDDLLDVSRVTTGKVVLKKSLIDLGSLLNRCLEAIKATARAHRLEVSSQLPVGLMVDGDPVRLEQIFSNLLVNAVKYSPPGSTIRVDVRAADVLAEVSVRDSGIGIEPQMLRSIFDLFAQVDTTLDRAQGGMGIGLTLVKSLTELHGGTVEAHSQGIGRGSEFVVKLPLSKSVGVKDEARPPYTRLLSRRVRVVLVEDSADIRETCKDALELLGCEVHVAETGPAGLECILSAKPDLALVDIGLPGMDGFELSRRARALGCTVKLVALTGYGAPEDQQRARLAGFDEHLTKPVTIPVLERAIANTLAS
jgi:signal transduction histidine kinase